VALIGVPAQVVLARAAVTAALAPGLLARVALSSFVIGREGLRARVALPDGRWRLDWRALVGGQGTARQTGCNSKNDCARMHYNVRLLSLAFSE
jgi:hypothetical protein